MFTSFFAAVLYEAGNCLYVSVIQGGGIPLREYATGKISLSRIFSESIHLPTRREDTGVYPLYPHKIGSEIVKRAIRSAGWHKNCKTDFNSPSNIRLVCLDQQSAHVSCWNTPITYGRRQDLAHPLYQQYLDGSQQVLLDPALVGSDTAGLNCLVRDYVCSNIEELWVTAEVFGVARFRNPEYARFYNVLRALNPGQVVGLNEMGEFLEQEIKRDLRTTFPLLRCIVVVVKPPQHLRLEFQRYAQRTREVSKFLNEIYPNQRKAVGEVPIVMQEIASKSGFAYAVCVLPGADMLKFSLGDYKYDDEFLAPVKDMIIKKYTVSDKLQRCSAGGIVSGSSTRDS